MGCYATHEHLKFYLCEELFSLSVNHDTATKSLKKRYFGRMSSRGARHFFLQVLWGSSAFLQGWYEMRVIAYVSHGALLQHLPTISSIICSHVCSLKRLWGP